MSSEEDMDSTSKALSYPEILVCIVKHLPGRDIINFRRVCKLWNEYCDPKFVFRNFDLQPQEIDVLLRKAGCRRLNLEFQDCDLKCISNEMWKMWSPKLRSLCIYGCITEVETLQSIISNCIGLEVLKIVLKRYFQANLLEQLLDYFIEREGQHTRLRRLSMNGQIFMKMSQLLKLCTVFPCIVDLRCNVGRGGDDGRCTCLKSYGTYDMRKLRRNNGLWSERPVPPMLDYQLFRLKTYKTPVKFYYVFKDDEIREQLFNFFTIQKDLEVIDLPIYDLPTRSEEISDDNFGVSIKSLIFHVLKSCPNLREFRLQQKPLPDEFVAVTLTSQESIELFSLLSNLQCFKIPFILEKDSSETTVLSSSLPSLSLSALQLNTRDSYFFSIVKLCPRLKHLNIDIYSDQQLREIILSMPDLEILILRLHDCTNYGLTGENEESSIQRLQKLEFLHIIDCKGRITKEVFNEFRFPRLEYLGLCLKHAGDSLPETLLNMPSIRTLEVFSMDENFENFSMDDNFYWTPEVITKLCKSLGNLQHLIVDKLASERNLSDEIKLKIFNSLPNLRFITCYWDPHIFIFDRRSGKANSSRMCSLQFWEEKYYKKMNRELDCYSFRHQLLYSSAEKNF